MASIALLTFLFSARGYTQNDTSDHRDSEKWDGCQPQTVEAPRTFFGVASQSSYAKESEAGWHTTAKGWLPYWPTRHYWQIVLRKIKWMCIIAIDPEVGVTVAAQDFWSARRLRAKVNQPRFTLIHAFYALMGGFVIAIPAESDGENKTGPNSTQEGQRPAHQAAVARYLPDKYEYY
ncbi:hypothetical protein BJX62DRAFT_243850 [Aspergillus germanicus]